MNDLWVTNRWTKENEAQAEERIVCRSSIDAVIRRKLFVRRLETYCAPRPKSYADRKWLEGYCRAARNIPDSPPMSHSRVLPEVFASFRSTMQVTHLSAKQNGAIDAWLDAVGC